METITICTQHSSAERKKKSLGRDLCRSSGLITAKDGQDCPRTAKRGGFIVIIRVFLRQKKRMPWTQRGGGDKQSVKGQV